MNDISTTQQAEFNVVARVIHWGMAILLITLFLMGENMVDLPKGGEKWELYDLHKSLGVLAAVFIIFRIYWYRKNQYPKPQGKSWQKTSAKIAHRLLYALMVLFPLSGFMMSMGGGHDVSFFGLFTLPNFIPESEFIHETGKVIHDISHLIFMLVVILHIAGAFYHQFIDRDGTLMRMIYQKK